MSDLAELYQSIILDHNRRPRNFGELADANRQAEGRNPLCGDQLTLWLRMDGDVIADVSFVGSGCAISKASASAMTAAVKGKTRAEAEALFERFHRLVTGRAAEGDAAGERPALGTLAAFGGVARFPIRVKCASLSWHALRSALASADGAAPTATTE
jgi:nitrogen fixation protein NifU and related proteins